MRVGKSYGGLKVGGLWSHLMRESEVYGVVYMELEVRWKVWERKDENGSRWVMSNVNIMRLYTFERRWLCIDALWLGLARTPTCTSQL